MNWQNIIKRLIAVSFYLLAAGFSLAQNGTVRGKITDGTEALAAATVSLGNQTTISGSNGEFIFSAKPGKYVLTVSYAGFRKQEKAITVTAGSIQDLEFRLQVLSGMENVIVLGSRSLKQRSNLNTAVPVDIIQLSKQPEGQTELTRIINNHIPSFNAAPHGFGGGRHMIPASLRGLGPDQTLVLLNGRRLHNIAAPWTLGVTGFGTVGTDLNAVSSAAIETVEVLRDGASAQYGSDAIAGIINLRLKRSTRITSVNLQTGRYYKGDGEAVSFSINRGFDLPKNGYINLTAHFRFNNYTQRNGEYTATVYKNFPANATSADSVRIRMQDDSIVQARGFNRMDHRPVGDNRVYNTGFAMNGNYPLNKRTTLFWTTVCNYRFVKDISSNQYRYPKDSLRIITQLYPDGFLPFMQSKIPDLSVIGGIEGETPPGWKWDAAISFGKNAGSVIVFNTNNASQYMWGINAPVSFYTGKHLFSQTTGNINFKRELSKLWPAVRSLTIAFGAELRIDHYRIEEGEEASWQNYSPSSGKEGGSQGLGGFRPQNAVNEKRYVTGAYIETEMENKKLLLNFAGRYEYYSDFGSNIAGKIAVRYKMLKQLSWRSSVSNGFRAPSLQQRFYSLITTVSRPNGLFRTGTFRNDSDLARAFGISPLKAENAMNLGTGFTSTISKNITLTVDAYWIQIKNRILYSGTIPNSFRAVDSILKHYGFNDVQNVRFFSNAINTRTKGLDIVMTGRWFIKRSSLEASLSANFTHTNIYGTILYAKNLPDNETYRTLLVNREERCRIEDAYPADKIILNVTYTKGKWKINTNHFRYGSVSQKNNNAQLNPDQTFSPKIVSALSVAYKMRPWLLVTIAAENMFNVYPDKLKYYNNTSGGVLIYNPNFSVFGCNGGYYFLNMTINL